MNSVDGRFWVSPTDDFLVDLIHLHVGLGRDFPAYVWSGVQEPCFLFGLSSASGEPNRLRGWNGVAHQRCFLSC